jgi:hypothetical protein
MPAPIIRMKMIATAWRNAFVLICAPDFVWVMIASFGPATIQVIE